MKIKKLTRNHLILLIVINLTLKIFISPIYIDPPYIPHDFSGYIGTGKCMAEGKYLMWDCTSWATRVTPNSNFGPIYSMITMFWYLTFGESFFMFKVLSIMFDVLNCIVFYFILRMYFNKEKSFYLSILFSLSYITIFSTAVLSNNGPIFLFFLFLSIYYMLNDRIGLSAIFYSISIMTKAIPLSIFPVLMFYVWKKYGSLKGLKYLILSLAMVLIIILPFLFVVKLEDALFSFVFFSKEPSGQMSFFNILRLSTDIDLMYLNKYFLIGGYFFTLLFIFLRQSKNYELELFRNINLIFVVGLLLGFYLQPYYLYNIFPFFILYATYRGLISKNKYKFFCLGTSLIVLSLIIYSIIYRWGLVEYSGMDRLFLVISTLLVPLGTFYQLKTVQKNYRIAWILIVLAIVMFSELHAAPFEILPLDFFSEWIDLNRMKVVMSLFGDHITSKKRFLAYGISYGGSAVIMWAGLIYYCYILLKDEFKDKKNIT